MDQIDLAESSGVAQSYISDLEAGRKVDPGIRTFERLSKGLGVSLGVLLGIAKDHPRPPLPASRRPHDHSPTAQAESLAKALARVTDR